VNEPSMTRGDASGQYRILSLDGGGIRGLLTARILERIEKACPGFVSRIDLIAGTSSGAMIAVGLARGLSLPQIVSIFVKSGPLIFRKTFLREVLGLMGILSAKFGTENRRKALLQAVGDVTLGDLSKRVVLSTFQLDSENQLAPSDMKPRMWKAKFFHNYPGLDSDAQEPAVDVILRSSAAPTYFPIYQGFVDGGVVANNPSVCGLTQAMHPEGGRQNLDALVLLSVGAGLTPNIISSRFGNFGFLQWGLRLFELISDGSVGLPDYQCGQLLGRRYFRMNPVYKEYIAIDDPNGIDALIAMADGVELDSCIAWVRANWM